MEICYRLPVDRSRPIHTVRAAITRNAWPLAILKAKADLPDAAWDWTAGKGPVSPAEK